MISNVFQRLCDEFCHAASCDPVPVDGENDDCGGLAFELDGARCVVVSPRESGGDTAHVMVEFGPLPAGIEAREDLLVVNHLLRRPYPTYFSLHPVERTLVANCHVDVRQIRGDALLEECRQLSEIACLWREGGMSRECKGQARTAADTDPTCGAREGERDE